MITAISAIIVFLLLILVHEFGHFLSAKAADIKVLEFAIGMGPQYLKQRGETVCLFGLAYRRFLQNGGEDEDSQDEGHSATKAFGKGFLCLLQGHL